MVSTISLRLQFYKVILWQGLIKNAIGFMGIIFMEEVAKSKVLIIDDEEDVARLVSKRIQSRGMDVLSLNKGEGALERVLEFLPDVILLDIWLPDFSGIEIFKQLRADPRTQKIPVVFFSANPLKEDYCRNELRAEGFLKKPYESQELFEVMERVIGK